LQVYDEFKKKKKTYMLILEGTFSDDITTTGTSFQEDPCSAVSSVKRRKN
jgi:hypothetical protein